MQNLLTERLKKLESNEFVRFELYLKSPYFHKGEKAIDFFDIVKPFYPDFNLTKSTQTKISKLFISKISFDVLLSRVNDLLDEFEEQELYQQKTFLKNAIKYELQLDKKNNVKYYYKLQQTQHNIHQSSDDLYAAFYKEFASIAVCENNWINDKEKIIMHSNNAMNNIMHFFLSKYLMIYANQTTHNLNITEAPKETIETKMVLNFVQENLEKQPISVQCVYYIIQMFKNISGSNKVFDLNFEKLKQQTFHLQKETISYEVKYALIQASSACIFKCYAEPKYFQNAFELIQFLVEKDLYFSVLHDLMIQQRFILIVKVALGAGKIDWAKQFIEEKIILIKKETRNDFYNYALGLIYFHIQDYSRAVKLMIKINLNTAQFIVDYKISLLKMQYELDEITGFTHQAQTFLKFLRKDKSLNKTHKKNVIDSIEFIKWLFKYRKNKQNIELLKKIKSKNLEYLVLNYRDKWFSEKYNIQFVK